MPHSPLAAIVSVLLPALVGACASPASEPSEPELAQERLDPAVSYSTHRGALPGARLPGSADAGRLKAPPDELRTRSTAIDPGDIVVIRLVNRSAEELSVLVQQLLDATRAPARPSDPRVTIVADPRTNSLIVAGDQDLRRKVESLVHRLDVPQER